MATGGLFNAKLTYNATAGTNLDLTGDTVTKYNVGHGTTGVAYDLTINNPTNAISATSKYSATNLPLPTMTTMASYYGLNTALLSSGSPRRLKFHDQLPHSASARGTRALRTADGHHWALDMRRWLPARSTSADRRDSPRSIGLPILMVSD